MSFPTVREAFLVILATLFFLFSLDLGIPEGAGKAKLLLLEAFVAVPAVIFTVVRRYNFREIFRWKKTDIRLLLVSVLIGAGLHAPIDLLDGFVQKILPMPEFLAEALTDLLRIGNTRELIIVVLAGVAAAGLTEGMSHKVNRMRAAHVSMPAIAKGHRFSNVIVIVLPPFRLCIVAHLNTRLPLLSLRPQFQLA